MELFLGCTQIRTAGSLISLKYFVVILYYCHYEQCQLLDRNRANIIQQLFVRQLSGSSQAVIRQSSGSCQVVIRQSSTVGQVSNYHESSKFVIHCTDFAVLIFFLFLVKKKPRSYDFSQKYGMSTILTHI